MVEWWLRNHPPTSYLPLKIRLDNTIKELIAGEAFTQLPSESLGILRNMLHKYRKSDRLSSAYFKTDKVFALYYALTMGVGMTQHMGLHSKSLLNIYTLSNCQNFSSLFNWRGASNFRK